MNHALYGATLPFMLGALVYLFRRGRASVSMLVLVPIAMAVMAVWASVPDIPRALGFQDLYLRWSFDPRINLFLWHYTIDQTEVESSWDAVWVALEAAALMAAALRELFRQEEH